MVIVWRKRDRAIRRRLRAGDDVSGEDLHQARLVAMDLKGKRFRSTNWPDPVCWSIRYESAGWCSVRHRAANSVGVSMPSALWGR